MKNECLIIRDLLPNYIENLVSDETKQYVNNHISKCEECKQILNDMNGENIEENNNILYAEEAEIRLIKKHKKQKLILKMIGIILLVIFLITLIIFNIKFIPMNSIRAKAYNKLQELKEMENYKITVERIEKVNDMEPKTSVSTYYYKDGKYKEEKSRNRENEILYYSDENSNTVTINKETGEISTSNITSYTKKGEVFEDLNYDIQLYSKNLLTKLGMPLVIDLKEETYNNKEYYVLERSKYGFFKKQNDYVRQFWINKDTMILERVVIKVKSDIVAEGENDEIIYEYKFFIEPNVVTDEDVTFPDISNFKAEN